MRKNIFLFLLVFFITTAAGLSGTKINPYLQAELNKNSDNSQIPVYITFNNTLTLNDFADIPYDTPKQDRRRIVIDRLINHANSIQSRVRSQILSRSGEQTGYEVLWMVNAIKMNAAPSLIVSLDAGNYSEISSINYDPQFPVELLLDETATPAPFMNMLAPEPGIVLMNADDVWALGNKGWGVKVGNSDDGFWWRHPDLVKGVWQNLGEDANNNGMTIIWGSGTSSAFDAGDLNGIDNDGNGKVDDLIGWDFGTNSGTISTASHGSATLGHVIGDGTGGTQTGVAPWAKCMVMRNTGGFSVQISVFQYALLMGMDVVTSSLSYKWYFNPKPDYSLVRVATDMSLAAGMLHTNSTSNDGNSVGIPLNISTAGCNPAPWRHPDQLLIGNLSGVIGVGNVNCNTDVIATSSPHGPWTWGNWALWNSGTWPYTIAPGHSDYPYSRVAPVEVPDSMGLKKPDVSAPGESSISTYVSSGSGYGTFGGTSSATPHTAGCVALMLSINPEMLPGDVDRVLELTAIEKGDPGKDYRYGAGRIDALLATTSPSCLTEGINGGSNWLINQTTPANDTARELVGLKLRNTVSPWIGSLRQLVFSRSGTAGTNDIEKFRLFWDVNKNNIVDAGDRLLYESMFDGASNQIVMDTIKFKITDTLRHVILCAKTKAGANSSNTVVLGMPNNTYFKSYYTTHAQATNFPYGTTLTSTGTGTETPVVFSLKQNFPNPFNPATIINFTLAKQSLVKIRVYDALGREVALLINNVRDAGSYNIEFDANTVSGLSSGIYFYKMEAFDTEGNSVYYTDIKKMMLIK
ncbi:MAG: Bacillopeptidase F [Chlorobi bacterium OLB5]|nr:MAG: Bacillopeptidase F [Chlorobi bacterium OLB5]